MMLNPAPINIVAVTDAGPVSNVSELLSGAYFPRVEKYVQGSFGSAVHPNQNSPIANKNAPTAIGAHRASGTGLPPAASTSLAYRGWFDKLMIIAVHTPTNKPRNGKEPRTGLHPRFSSNTIGNTSNVIYKREYTNDA
jgi:hypothetical protein